MMKRRVLIYFLQLVKKKIQFFFFSKLQILYVHLSQKANMVDFFSKFEFIQLYAPVTIILLDNFFPCF